MSNPLASPQRAAAAAANAPQYTVTELGTLGGPASYGIAVNAGGQVIGNAQTADGAMHAFVWNSGQTTDLGTFGGRNSYAAHINSTGQVVGCAQTVAGVLHAFLWDSGQLTDLGTLEGLGTSRATAISADGQVVGRSGTASGREHAVLWRPGAIIDLGLLGGLMSHASGVNDSGFVVGSAHAADGTIHAILWDQQGNATDLGQLPGFAHAQAVRISRSGQVIGVAEAAGHRRGYGHAFLGSSGRLIDLGLLPGAAYTRAYDLTDSKKSRSTGNDDNDDDGVLIVGASGVAEHHMPHAVVWSRGTLFDLNSRLAGASGWHLSEARGINDSGSIVGTGTHNGVARGFLLQPV